MLNHRNSSYSKKTVLNLIKEKLLYPFKEDLIFFLLLWLLISLPNCYSQKDNVTYAIYLAMMYYIITYFIDVIINLNQVLAKILRPIILVISTLFCLINLYCVNVYGCLLSNDYIQIIAGTNLGEAREYFSTFLSWKEITLFTSIIVISILIAFKLPKLKLIKFGRTWVIASILMLISVGAIFHNSGIIKEEIEKKKRWNFSFEEVVDLRNHVTHPKIVESDSIHPQQIVIILGEAFSANHSSLYGYEKSTNPLLEKKVKEGNLIVFKNVSSPSTHTISAFKYILNTFRVNSDDEKPWYEHTNIIETMKAAGYHTVWISNQAEKGMFDNVPSSHAKLCDETFFLENVEDNNRYDGSLIGKKSLKLNSNNCIFYHLMGQHENFQERYPKNFNIFKSKDYETFPVHQRDILASYDNATLYNDFVVNSIMELYKNHDAVVFYFPDHALDIFNTEMNYFGHAKATKESQKYGKKIPFMIYVSPTFKKIHTQKAEQMRRAVNKSFCTDRFIYMAMDVSDFRFRDNDDVNKYTIFQ